MKTVAILSGAGLVVIAGLALNCLGRTSSLSCLRKTSSTQNQANANTLCGSETSSGKEAPVNKLTDDELERLGRYLVGRSASTRTIPTSKEIADATGLQVADREITKYGVAALLRIPDGRKLLEGLSCERFQACSFARILDSKSKADVDLYSREKADDGRTYDGLRLPAFEGRDLDGKPVRSSDLIGTSAVVVLLSLHCNHSVESLPLLSKLAEQLKPEGGRVIGVLVNSGDVEDAKYWIPYYDRQYRRQYDIWVADASIGDAAGSHLTPTYLMVDRKAHIRKKLVGFKTYAEAAAGLKEAALD
ncbi:MAG: TlpA disulfide reductase family protein [Bryobacteraceae bacterium]